MGQKRFPPFKTLDDVRNKDDDESTVINASNLESERAHSVMYIPDEGRFSSEANTLIDGMEGTSSSTLGNRWKASGLNSSLQQLQYNENKVALDRSIKQTIELLYQLSEENKERPIFYPTDIEDDSLLMLNSRKAHIALIKNKEISAKAWTKAKIEDKEDDEILPELKILKLNLQIDVSKKSNGNLVSNLDKKSIANLLEQMLKLQVKYLSNLKDRIDDTSSKVFVTGDLNAGKSTFCNALLRKKVLPEDQQPCTSVFCEVIDATKENKGVEEVHAIPIGKKYNIRDESSYEIHPLKGLENLVYECDRYSLLKVYVKDNRSFQESLLSNGVIDIKLIDAPGLNMDLYLTTQVFSRQEEIDLVVFVVNSENHFTLSAKEFIAAAAAEKRYVFIVVNRFDNINNKEKCKEKILDQVKSLSPDTYKNAEEFVHFVSSTEAYKGGPDDDNDPDDDNGNDKKDPDFDLLEASLRKFILDKRSLSKLLPAKSYLKNILCDLETLSMINEKIYLKEKEDKEAQLKDQVAPRYLEMASKSSKMSDHVNNVIEKACVDVYNFARNDLIETLNDFEGLQVILYRGLQYVYEYAKETQKVMIETVLSSIQNSEDRARIITSEKVDEISRIGEESLGSEFMSDKKFNPDIMFTKRRDNLKKLLNRLIEIGDFFDPSWDSCLMWLGIPKDYVSSTKEHLNYYNPMSLLPAMLTDVTSLKNQLPTQLTLHSIYSSGKLLTTGVVVRKLYLASYLLNPSVLKRVAGPLLVGVTGFTIYYLINDIPNAFPRKQARKIKKQLLELDHPHQNANRISKECRKVLNYPARQVMNNFQTSIDKRLVEKKQLEKDLQDSNKSFGYFHDFLLKIEYQRNLLEQIDLENVNIVD
ncbi:uncharacterized protein PRCAT00000482001 [Priceomyces carsonii]|uniref:uncharacterized protein n=1 Tax=Priceomyces carsonii TaxID=28549 RepID=UPI002ED8D84A|nr:unnamed protein product [Priceomyces carsonii]